MAKIHSNKIVSFNVPRTEKEIVRVQTDHVPYFYDQLHQHPELQIMLIEKGAGTLIAGDYVGRFGPKDMFVLGSSQPHVFRCDPVFYKTRKTKCKSISLYFNEDYGGHELWNTKEWKAIHDFKQRSQKGFRIIGETARLAYHLIQELTQTQGLDKMITFCRLLKTFTESSEKIPLAIQGSSLPQHEESRMNNILEFTFKESHRKITIHEVAQLAHLSTEAFCRYFKLHTRKTYVSFLNEVRISHACRLLIQKDYTIQQISSLSGFNNISNFNRIFKKVTGITPYTYRKQLPFSE